MLVCVNLCEFFGAYRSDVFGCSLEYAYEPAEAFYEFVLGTGSSSQPLTNAECPYSVLGLAKGASTSQVKIR